MVNRKSILGFNKSFLFQNIFLDVFFMLFEPRTLPNIAWLNTYKSNFSNFTLLTGWIIGVGVFNFAYSVSLRSSLISVEFTKEMNTFEGLKFFWKIIVIIFNNQINNCFSEMLDLNVPLYLTKGSSLVENMKFSAKSSLRKTLQKAKENNHFTAPVRKILSQHCRKTTQVQARVKLRDFWSKSTVVGLHESCSIKTQR